MMSASPSVDNLTIENLLYATSTDRGAAGRGPYFGYRRVNDAAAAQAAAAHRQGRHTGIGSAHNLAWHHRHGLRTGCRGSVGDR